jgi:hypothetical protein
MRVWPSKQRLRWLRALARPENIGAIRLAPDFMIRNLALGLYRMTAASPAAHAFLKEYDAIAPLHSKRSPRLDDLRRMQQAGLELIERENRGATQRLLLGPLAKMSLQLGEPETLLQLFEAAVPRRFRLRRRELDVLIQACELLLPQWRTSAPELAERLDSVRQLVVTIDPAIPPAVQRMLAIAGNRYQEQVAELRAIPPAERTPAQWETLISRLLERSQEVEDLAPLVEAIGMLDSALPLLSSDAPHTPEGSGPRLLIWLSIVVAAKAAFAAERDVLLLPMENAIGKAARLGRILFHPLQLYEEQVQSAPNGKRGRVAHAWAVLSIDLLWHVAFEAGQELRRTVLYGALDGGASGLADRLNLNAAGVDLFRRLHQCEDMWLDAESRAELLRRYIAVLDMIDEPRRTVVRGLCHLAEDEEDAAEELFASRRDPSFNTAFNGSGHITFVPAKDAAAHLADPVADPRFLPESCGFRFDKTIRYDQRRMVAVACADPEYVRRYYRRYTSSFFRFDRRSTFHLHLLGRPEDLDPEIRQLIAENARVSLSSEDPPVRMPYYYATARFLRAPLFQKATRSAVMLTDFDIRFASSPHRMLPKWQAEGDVGLRLYDKIRWFPRAGGMTGFKSPRLETWGSLNASCVFLGRTGPARRFAEDLSHVAHYALAKFDGNGNSNWWIDQNVLYASLRPILQRIEGLRLFNLLDVGIPFGAYRSTFDEMPPPRGHRPGFPHL